MDSASEFSQPPEPQQKPVLAEWVRPLVFPPDNLHDAFWEPPIPLLEWMHSDSPNILHPGDVLFFNLEPDVSTHIDPERFVLRFPFIATGEHPTLPEPLLEEKYKLVAHVAPLLNGKIDHTAYWEQGAMHETFQEEGVLGVSKGIGVDTATLFAQPRLVVSVSENSKQFLITRDRGDTSPSRDVGFSRRGDIHQLSVSSYSPIERSLETVRHRQQLQELERAAREKMGRVGKAGVIGAIGTLTGGGTIGGVAGHILSGGDPYATGGGVFGGVILGEALASTIIKPRVKRAITEHERAQSKIWGWQQHRIDRANSLIALEGRIPVQAISLQRVK